MSATPTRRHALATVLGFAALGAMPGLAQTALAQTAQTRTAQLGTAQTGTAQTGTAQTGTAPTGAKPTDPQTAHIAYTAGVIDIKNARLALEKSRNRDVRAFAQDMVRDHTSVNDKALALVKRLNVTPEDNPTSQSLVQQQDTERTRLGGLSGAAFDKAYIANEVAYHKAVNGALETTLIPAAQNAELKTLLQSGLRIFQEHQRHAERLAATMR